MRMWFEGVCMSVDVGVGVGVGVEFNQTVGLTFQLESWSLAVLQSWCLERPAVCDLRLWACVGCAPSSRRNRHLSLRKLA